MYFETRPQLINYFILRHLASMLLVRHVPSPWSMELSTIMFTFSSNSLDDAIVPVIQDRSWQCHLCTYEQDLVPGSRSCIMCHSTRRRLYCAPQLVGKSKLIVRTRGSGKLDCPNCRLAERCKACLLARHEKCINDTWIDAKGPLK